MPSKFVLFARQTWIYPETKTFVSRRTSATDLAELLHRHMPRLTELYLDSDEEYSDAVLAAFDP